MPAKFLTLKALFLLAISSLKRIGDLQALSVASSCPEFAPGMVKAFLHSRPGYVPKVPANVARSIMLQAFCPPPFQNADQERHNLLCVGIRCLCPQSCHVVKKLIEAISLAYESAGQPSPMAVRSHSTRIMAASKALVCDAPGWSSLLTFIKFYSLDLDSTPGSQVVSS